MPVVRVTEDIAAPPRAVWDAAMDPQRTPEWVTIVRGLTGTDSGPLRVGFRMQQRLCLRGVTFTVDWTLEEMDAPRFARWTGHGPARSKALIEDRLTPAGAGTRFDYVNDFRAPFGPLGAAAARRLVGGVPEREARASLARLKSLLEAP